MKRVRILFADPNWKHNDRREYRLDNPEKKAKSGVGAAGKYALGTAHTAEICALGPQVQWVCASDCYLFLWVTCLHLADGLAVIDAWGFQYSSVAFVWCKTNYKSQTWFAGPGNAIPSNAELCLFARRKKSKTWHPTTGKKPCQIVAEPHARDLLKPGRPIIHSRKPESVQGQVERWLGPALGDYAMMELYATRNRPGWVCLGHSVTGNRLGQDLAEYARC